MSQTDSPLGTAPVGKLVLQLAIPAMLAQFVNILYSVVDRMYVGHIAGAGDAALAGVGVCAPVVTMITAIGALIGFGGGPLMSIRMGRRDGRRPSDHHEQLLPFAGAERAGDRAAAYFQAADSVHLRLQRAPVGLRAGVLYDLCFRHCVRITELRTQSNYNESGIFGYRNAVGYARSGRKYRT